MTEILTPAERRQINRMQRRALNKIVRYYRRSEAYDGVTSIRIELSRGYGRSLYLSVVTRRSDCDKASMRAIMCEHRGLFAIGPRGKISVLSTSTGISPPEHQAWYQSHVAKMLNATNRK